MPRRLPWLVPFGPAFVGLLLSTAPVSAARIEAVAGKRYTLTREHGPWMIMVASFHTTGADGQTEEGKSPEQAADELVLELRRKGIPGYVYAIEPEAQLIQTIDRQGRPDRRKNLRRVKSIGVLAGNYENIDDKLAQKTLGWVKDYDPKCLKEGVVFQASATRRTPLAGAFLTVNPLLAPDEVAARQLDPLLLRLNHGERYSLLGCKGDFTLVIASFSGKAKTTGHDQQPGDDFLKDNDLDNAAQEARDLAVALRQHEKVDAFVWHDRKASLVTVGSFDSQDDPGIAGMRQRFGALQRVTTDVPPSVMGVKFLALDARGSRITDVVDPSVGTRVLNVGSVDYGAIARIWPFEPNPQLMRVPRKN